MKTNLWTWRPLTGGDTEALDKLDDACKQVDGSEPVSDLSGDALRAAHTNPEDAIGAQLPDGSLAAAGWVRLSSARATLSGRVRPDYRRQGLGTHLMEWSMGRAARKPKLPVAITNEALTTGAQTLYTRFGFIQSMAENMLVRDLLQEIPPVSMPFGMEFLDWKPSTAGLFFTAYCASFYDRPGFPNPAPKEWVEDYEDDNDFRPEISRVASRSGKPVGFITCSVYSGYGWISQVGTAPEQRGKGLASALVTEALHQFADGGLKEAALHVNLNNPSAERLYARLGFTIRLTRGRYFLNRA